MFCSKNESKQSRPVTRGGGEEPLENFSRPLEKCVGHYSKLLDIVQKIWAPLRNVFAPPGVISWLRDWNKAVRS